MIKLKHLNAINILVVENLVLEAMAEMEVMVVAMVLAIQIMTFPLTLLATSMKVYQATVWKV